MGPAVGMKCHNVAEGAAREKVTRGVGDVHALDATRSESNGICGYAGAA
jgi:hypothetical protein